MQCAWMTSRHGENDPYWCVVAMQEISINYYKLLNTCHQTQVDSFVTSRGCAQSKEAIQDHWLIDYSTVSAFGAKLSWQRCKRCKSGLWSSLSGEHATKRGCGYFCTASITEPGLSNSPKVVICHIKENAATLYHLLPIPELILMLISLFGHILKQVIDKVHFVYFFYTYLVIYDLKNITYAKWYMKIIKQHFCFTYFLN